MRVTVDISAIESKDLITVLDERGDLPMSNISDFGEDELRQALGYEDEPVDWGSMYQKIMTGCGEQAFEQFKAIVQDRTGRIIV
jgi:hypothetical protein